MGKIYISDTELYHWKYIKKEKVNGKWVYYYDESELKAKETAMNRAQESYDKATKQWNSAANAQARYNETFLKDGSKRTGAEQDTSFALSKPLSRLSRTVVEAGKKYTTAKQEYMTAKISSFAERTISKGIVAVANFFSKIFG